MARPLRIVSLISSATEIACALGYQQQLVGRSHECDFPPEIRELPVCSEPCIDVQAGSLEIDRQVRQALREAVSVYRVFHQELERLQPTHVLTQTQCEVCAVSLKDVEEALCRVVTSRPEIIAHQPMCLADIWRDIERTAEAFGDPQRGTELTARLQARLEGIRSRRPAGTPVRVVCLEWLEPIMSAGNWVPELVGIAGGVPLLCQAGRHSPYLSWESLRESDPEVIVIMPCGFDLARTASERHVLEEHPEWAQLRAVKNRAVYFADGSQYFNRPGPRVVESAEILAQILLDYQHGGCGPLGRDRIPGWLRWDEVDDSLGKYPQAEQETG